jgi:serine/threonine protein kinase
MASPQINYPLPYGFQLDRYRIERQLSLGGFSIVYLAYDEDGTPVAIKEYLPNSLALRTEGQVTPVIPEEKQASFRHGMKCFFEEGRALAHLSHPNVVRVLNFFRANETVYMVNNGVYRTGFARSQEAYDEAAARLFGALDTLEATLEDSAYLVGDEITESDWRLFTTAIRFDPVYYVHFKCSRNQYRDFPNLSRHLEALRSYPGVDDTVRLDHIRYHYFRSHLRINPYGIIPIGPIMDWEGEA